MKNAFLSSLNNRFLIIPKLIYFFSFAAACTCYTFRGKFFVQVLGFNEAGFAGISAGMYLVVFFSALAWTYISDHIMRPKLIIQICVIGMVLAFHLYLIVGHIPSQSKHFVALALTVIHTFFVAGVQPLVDGFVVSYLSRSSIEGVGKELYGKQRLWGTVGYVSVTFLVGASVDAEDRKNHANVSTKFNPIYYILASLSVVFLIILTFGTQKDDPVAEKWYIENQKAAKLEEDEMKKNDIMIDKQELGSVQNSKSPQVGISVNKDPDIVKPKQKFSSLRELLLVFKNTSFIFLLLVAFFCGYSKMAISTIGPLYVEDRIIGMSNPHKKTLVSIRTFCGVLSEVAVYAFGAPLLKKFGNMTLLFIAIIVMTCRSWGYAGVPEGNISWLYFIYFIEMLRGISAGCLQIAAVQLCSTFSVGSTTSILGFYNGFYYGLTGLIGCGVTAIILRKSLESLDYKLAFGICASLVSGFLLISIAVAVIRKLFRK